MIWQNEGKYITYTKKSITEKGLKNSSAWLVPEKSLLYSMYASVGFVSINKTVLQMKLYHFNYCKWNFLKHSLNNQKACATKIK